MTRLPHKGWIGQIGLPFGGFISMILWFWHKM
jgi:hypothetical protein